MTLAQAASPSHTIQPGSAAPGGGTPPGCVLPGAKPYVKQGGNSQQGRLFEWSAQPLTAQAPPGRAPLSSAFLGKPIPLVHPHAPPPVRACPACWPLSHFQLYHSSSTPLAVLKPPQRCAACCVLCVPAASYSLDGTAATLCIKHVHRVGAASRPHAAGWALRATLAHPDSCKLSSTCLEPGPNVGCYSRQQERCCQAGCCVCKSGAWGEKRCVNQANHSGMSRNSVGFTRWRGLCIQCSMQSSWHAQVRG